MEYTELADYPLPAGTLTEWLPVVTDASAWNADDRPVSFTHEDHCSRGNDGSWIGTVFEIHRRFDVDGVAPGASHAGDPTQVGGQVTGSRHAGHGFAGSAVPLARPPMILRDGSAITGDRAASP